MTAKCAFLVYVYMYFCMYVLFFSSEGPQLKPLNRFLCNAQWLKRRGLSQGSALQASFFQNCHFIGVSPKTSKFSPTVRKHHEHNPILKLGTFLSESAIEIYLQHP